jgi:hypothetical protein
MLRAEEEGKEHKELVGKCAHVSYISSEPPNVLFLKGGLKRGRPSGRGGGQFNSVTHIAIDIFCAVIISDTWFFCVKYSQI